MDASLAPPADITLDHTPDEMTVLTQFLDLHRVEFHQRVWGVSDEQLRMTTAASSLTLGGLIKHLALVEQSWFDDRFAGNGPSEPWASAPWDDDPDWEFHTAHNDSAAELLGLFVASCARSREVVAVASSLDQLSAELDRDGRHWNLRWIMVHMIEEYARHLGHADFLREAIDGTVG